MLENIREHSWGSIPPLRMPSLLPHDLCHEWNVSRRLQALLSTVAAQIYIPINSVEGFSFLHILADMVFLFFLVIVILTGVRRYLILVSIFISLMLSNVGYLCKCLVSTCKSFSFSFLICLLSSSAHFSVRFFVPLMLSCMNNLYTDSMQSLSLPIPIDYQQHFSQNQYKKFYNLYGTTKDLGCQNNLEKEK